MMQRMTLTRMISNTFGLDESTAFLITIVLAVMVFLSVAVPSFRQWFQKTDDAGKKQAARRLIIAASAIVLVVLTIFTVFRFIPKLRAEKAMEEGNYQLAVDLYHRLDMLSEEIAARKQLGEAAAANGNYDEAIRIFDYLNVQHRVKELRAEKALLSLPAGENQETLAELALLLDQPKVADILLQDSALRSAVLTPGRELLLGESVWDSTVWYIAAVQGDKALLLCTSLDKGEFHTDNTMSWETTNIRQKLQVFFEERLPEPVRDAVIVTQNQNLDSDGLHIREGKMTQDTLFIPSAEEAQQYLASLAGILNEKSLWTRTPIDGEDWGIYRAVLRQQEDGTNEVILINTAWSLVNEVFPVMWVDINQLLQNWASAE